MKKLLITSISILILANISFAKDTMPWDDNGKKIAEIVIKDSDYWGTWIGPKSIQHFVDRYGVKPQYMILDDLKRPVKMKWEIGFDRDWNHRTEPAPWGRDLVWGDIQKYFYWRFESAKTDSVFFVPLTYGDPTDSIQVEASWGDWWVYLSFDASELPIPNDGSAYYMTVEAHVGDPVDGKGVKFQSEDEYDWPFPPVIAHTTLQTPLDYYVQAFVDGLVSAYPDKATLMRLLPDFPYDQMILQSLISIYHKENKPDSVRWAGKLYLKSIREDLDDMMKDVRGEFQKIGGEIDFQDYGYDGEAQSYLEQIQEMLFELDGDTTLYK